MSANECVAVAVLYPWRWLGIALSIISISLWAWLLWCLKRRDVQLARSFGTAAQLAAELNLHDEAAELTRASARSAQRAWPLRVPPPSESGPVLAKPEEPR